MVADALAWLLAEPMRDGRLPGEVTILEIGAGDGALARDTLDRLVSRAHDPRLGPLAERVRYVIGERSPALRERQRARLAPHLESGRARVVPMDARAPSWHGPFQGVVLCNELLANVTCDRLRIRAPGHVDRVHVALDGPGDPWEAVARGRPPAIRELTLPVDADPALDAHIRAIGPLVDDLDALGLLPVDLCYGAGVPGFLDGVAPMLAGHGCWGVALVVDYGGTTRHLLDPRHTHLRVYGRPDLAHADSPYTEPGRLDITWDVDFSEIGRLAEERGLRMHHFGHQAMLESAEADLWGDELRPLLVEGRVREGAAPGEEAAIEAERLVCGFREANGFRTAILGPPDFSVDEARFGPSDPWAIADLLTVGPGAAEAARPVLAGLGLPDPAGWLLPGCDVVANLSAVHWYAARHEVLARLGAAGLLQRRIARRP